MCKHDNTSKIGVSASALGIYLKCDKCGAILIDTGFYVSDISHVYDVYMKNDSELDYISEEYITRYIKALKDEIDGSFYIKMIK